uniref:helix-turn-helix domain-containing protein n=1 Tax=uncultured Draconibacterium sp. TaxID=1573823 RepID=UPI0032164D17
MPTEIVTTDDLREFKIDLLKEFKQLLAVHHGKPSKKWLKSYEVRKLLGISPGTLQNLRVNGTLAYTKIGGVIFYDSEEIQKMMMENKVQNRFEFGRRK